MRIVLVAIALVLAVPAAQLRTIDVVTTCCCPDPSHCHCPDHAKDQSGQTSMRACHRTQHELASPQLPTFAAPELALAAPPLAPPTQPIVIALADPHAAPPPARPDAPS